ncbi:hypothetical protein JOE61_002396 [Nocardioides salarius]|uniref:Toxin-antitoxin system HicB family antitoxin n=1 Tax=Nocardioides salarius TaxID=374513 RepID=A0ABS2MBL5_9ACTN|nr:pilus assembly protein HicB [Nocardioides salarius]MBM7508582.1 hypothetical protein [Nocardioides salarius]
MDISPYVERLRHDLLAAAEAGGPEVRSATERLTYALDPAVRLALMEAVSHAAAEITSALPTGSVDVRLDGRDLDFVVDTTPPPAPAPPPPPPPSTEEGDDGVVARVTLRLPEPVKARAEELAARAGTSLNNWLVGVVRDATSESGDRAVRVDVDLSSLPFGGGRGRRLNGWI